MSSDYDFKYNLSVGFNEPDDVLGLITLLHSSEKVYDDEYGFHPALIQEGGDHLCLVENVGSYFSENEYADIHTCGCDDDTYILDNFILDIQKRLPGVKIDGYTTVICDAKDVEFTFYKNTILVKTITDDELAEIYMEEVD